jgi:NDP-sugar pyrophosphorylase family protein
MKAILICPAERPGVAFLAQTSPLVSIPVMGQTLLEYWLEALAGEQVKEVLILATDRPEQVRSSVSTGARWGLRVTVAAELKELSPAEASARFSQEPGDPPRVVLMDHFPGLPSHPLFESYASWIAGLKAWIPLAGRTARVGWRERQPGVWVGMRSSIAPSAELRAPCWIGENVRVSSSAQIGPGAVVENCVVIESAAEVVESYIGPETFVGTLTKISDSIAWGNTLIDWRSGSCIQVTDAFLLSPLGPRHLSSKRKAITARLGRLLQWLFVWPAQRLSATRSRISGA